jgi:hypothetical protein
MSKPLGVFDGTKGTHMSTRNPIDTFLSAVSRAERFFKQDFSQGAVSTHDVLQKIQTFEQKFDRVPQALVDLKTLGWQAREAEIRARGSVFG